MSKDVAMGIMTDHLDDGSFSNGQLNLTSAGA